MEACFQDTSVLDALNLTHRFDPLTGDDGLTSYLDVSVNLTEEFNFDRPGTEFADFKEMINTLTAEDPFGYNATKEDLYHTTCQTCTGFRAAVDALGTGDANMIAQAETCDTSQSCDTEC